MLFGYNFTDQPQLNSHSHRCSGKLYYVFYVFLAELCLYIQCAFNSVRLMALRFNWLDALMNIAEL